MFTDDSLHEAEDSCNLAVERQRRRFRACCPTLYFLARFLFQRVFGIALKCFFLLIFSVIFFYTYAIVIPFESQYKPWWLLMLLALFGLYLFGCVIFHFFMASLTHPGSPPKNANQYPLCRVCQNHKPPGTHHCSICGICVLRMDHHCVWLNTCVGARNHRYFLQFLGYIAFGMLFQLTAAYNTFYYNWGVSAFGYCSSELDAFPFYESLCEGGTRAVESLTMFVLMLTVVLVVLVGGFFLWNCILVTYGTTYIACLQGIVKSGRRFAALPSKEQIIRNWRTFLGLSDERSFWIHILLPSTHVAEDYVRVPSLYPEIEFVGVSVV